MTKAVFQCNIVLVCPKETFLEWANKFSNSSNCFLFLFCSFSFFFFFFFFKIRTTYTALAECLNKQLSATCQDYAIDQRLKDDIQKAVTAVLRGRRFFCEPVSLRAIDLDFKVRPLFPCSAEFLTEMEKCAVPVREEYRSQNITELCGWVFSLMLITTVHFRLFTTVRIKYSVSCLDPMLCLFLKIYTSGLVVSRFSYINEYDYHY